MRLELSQLARIAMLLFAGGFIPCSAWGLFQPGGQELSSPGGEVSPDISRRIASLNDVQYVTRQSATEKLSQAGPETLPELASAFLSGTTEQRWRILKIMESISLEGGEADFFRAVAAIRVLAGPRYQIDDMHDLQARWQDRQSDRAIRQLRDHGAVVIHDPDVSSGWVNTDPRLIQNNVIVLGNNEREMFRINELRDGNQPNSEDPASPDAAPPQPELTLPTSVADKRVMLEGIFSGDTDHNRQIVQLQLEDDSRALVSDNVNYNVAQFQVRNNIVIGQQIMGPGGRVVVQNFDMFGNIIPETDSAPNSVTFGRQWNGDLEQMGNLTAVAGLMVVRFDNRPEISAGEMRVLARSPSLSKIVFSGSQLAADAVDELAGLKQLQSLQLDLAILDDAMVQALTRLPNLQQLTLNGFDQQIPELNNIGKLNSLRTLELSDMQLDQAAFATLQQSPFLTQLFLVHCKFSLEDMRAYQAQSPNVAVRPTGQAFLGVRGMTTFNAEENCRISEVVPGSAAEAAGVQAEDVILTMDGHQIMSFSELTFVVNQKAPGDELEIGIVRDGKKMRLTAILGDNSQRPEF